MRLLLILLFAGLLSLPQPAAADDLAELSQTNRLLQTEWELAKSQKLYFVFDLPARRIQFRVSGVNLAELPLVGLRSWGRRAEGLAYTVAGKTARKEPEREHVLIPGKEPAKPESAVTEIKKPEGPVIQALEIADMPTEYAIRLDDGTLLTVHSEQSEGDALTRWRWKALRSSWFLTRPLLSVWHHLHGSAYNETLLILPDREARMLYWSLQEGSRCLIRWP